MKLGNIPKGGKNHGHAPMYPPPVPFKKTEKTQKPITKDEYKTVTLKIDPSDEAKDSPTIDKKVWLFADGTAEDWLCWRMEWEDVIRDKPFKTSTQHVTMALTLLKRRAKELFQEALKFQQEEEANYQQRRHYSIHKSTQRYRKTLLPSGKSVSTSTTTCYVTWKWTVHKRFMSLQPVCENWILTCHIFPSSQALLQLHSPRTSWAASSIMQNQPNGR